MSICCRCLVCHSTVLPNNYMWPKVASPAIGFALVTLAGDFKGQSRYMGLRNCLNVSGFDETKVGQRNDYQRENQIVKGFFCLLYLRRRFLVSAVFLT